MTKKIFSLLLIFIMIALQATLEGQSKSDKKVTFMQKRLKKYQEKNGIHVGLLIANESGIMLEAAFGENSHQMKNSLKTSFDLASIGKMFSGIIWAKLVQEGRINHVDSYNNKNGYKEFLNIIDRIQKKLSED